MTLINTAGMSFIGPGSEWFWTALGVIIAAVTLLGIYRQLRLQLGAGAIQQMETINQEFQSEQMSRARLAVLVALRDGADPASLPPVANDIANFWERVGYLVKAGHVDRVLVNQYFDASIRVWWGWLAPAARAARARDADPALYRKLRVAGWPHGRDGPEDRQDGDLRRGESRDPDPALHRAQPRSDPDRRGVARRSRAAAVDGEPDSRSSTVRPLPTEPPD